MRITKKLLSRLIRQSIKESRYAVSPTGVARKFDPEDPSFSPQQPGYKLIKTFSNPDQHQPHIHYTAEEVLQKYFGVSDISQLKTDAEKIEAQGVLDTLVKGLPIATSAEREQRTGKNVDILDLDKLLPVSDDASNKDIARAAKYPYYSDVFEKNNIRTKLGPFSMRSIEKRAKDLEARNDPSYRSPESISPWLRRGGTEANIPRITQTERSIYNQILENTDLYEHIKYSVLSQIEEERGETVSSLIDKNVTDFWMAEYKQDQNDFDSDSEPFAVKIAQRYPDVIRLLIYNIILDLEESGDILYFDDLGGYYPADYQSR